MKIVRGRLYAGDVQNPSQRYDSTCDCIQVTPDGGVTWTDAPGNDPRHANAFRMPALTGGTAQCDAAANKVKWLKDFIDQVISLLSAGATIYIIVNILLEFLELLFPAADFLVLIIDIAGALVTAGDALLEAAFTSTTYDALLCIFDCNSSADGQVSAYQLGRIESDVTAQLTTTAALVVNSILNVQGEVGLSNAGAIGSETGDCSGCSCGWTYEWDFAASDGGWFKRSFDEGNYVPGSGWAANCAGSPAGERVVIQYNVPTAPAVTTDNLVCDIDYVLGTNGGGVDGRQIVVREFNGSGGSGSVLAVSATSDPPTDNYVNIGFTSTQTPASLEINSWSSSGGVCDGSVLIRKARCSGSGTPPPLTGGSFI